MFSVAGNPTRKTTLSVMKALGIDLAAAKPHLAPDRLPALVAVKRQLVEHLRQNNWPTAAAKLTTTGGLATLPNVANSLSISEIVPDHQHS